MVAIERRTHDGTDEGVILERALGWPMQFSSNKYTFTEFGTKGGNLPSIVTEASYVATSEDDRTAVVLFLRDLSQADSNKLLSSFAHQSFMTKAATDRFLHGRNLQSPRQAHLADAELHTELIGKHRVEANLRARLG